MPFASFGTPSYTEGACSALGVGSCHAGSSVAQVEYYCLGQETCSVPATDSTFGDPCYDTVKSLAAEVICTTNN